MRMSKIVTGLFAAVLMSPVLLAVGAGSAQATTGSAIADLATANNGRMACQTNSLGGLYYYSSCTGNGGQPEYWCADFVRWVWANSAGIGTGGLNPAAASFYGYGVNNGTLSDTPHLGDAAVFSTTNSAGNIHHVAIVTGINGNGTVVVENGDFDGQSGTQAHFAATSRVVRTTINGTVGTYTAVEGNYLVKYVRPVGVTAAPTAKADLVRVNEDGSLTAWQNNNAMAGSWSAPGGIGGAGTADPSRLRYADLNADGKADLVRIDEDGSLTAWQNNNAMAGSWSAPTGIGGTGTTDQSRIRFADLNGDGKADLVRVNEDGSFTAWQNNNALAGSWSAPSGIGGTGTGDQSRIRFADLNGDGRADVVRINDDSSLTAWQNNNALAGSWSAPTGIGGTGNTDQSRVRFADLNGDGKAEVVLVNEDGSLTAWQNDNAMAGSWSAPTGIGGTGTTDQSRMEFADLG